MFGSERCRRKKRGRTHRGLFDLLWSVSGSVHEPHYCCFGEEEDRSTWALCGSVLGKHGKWCGTESKEDNRRRGVFKYFPPSSYTDSWLRPSMGDSMTPGHTSHVLDVVLFWVLLQRGSHVIPQPIFRSHEKLLSWFYCRRDDLSMSFPQALFWSEIQEVHRRESEPRRGR